jgi:hypothetical protein
MRFTLKALYTALPVDSNYQLVQIITRDFPNNSVKCRHEIPRTANRLVSVVVRRLRSARFTVGTELLALTNT